MPEGQEEGSVKANCSITLTFFLAKIPGPDIFIPTYRAFWHDWHLGNGMNRLGIFVAYSFVLCCIGCTRPLVPIEQTAIFPAKKAANLIRTVCYSPPDITGYWTPKVKDLENVEDNLVTYLNSQKGEVKRNWLDCRRQIVGVERGNDKFLFIYYFYYPRSLDETLKTLKPDHDPDLWKKIPERRFDGDSFRVLYEMKSKRFTWYERN